MCLKKINNLKNIFKRNNLLSISVIATLTLLLSCNQNTLNNQNNPIEINNSVPLESKDSTQTTSKTKNETETKIAETEKTDDETDFSYSKLSLDPSSFYSYVPNSDWMGEMANSIGNKKLREIVIPGTHDSCTYKISESSDFATDQTFDSILARIENINEKLNKLFNKPTTNSKMKKFIYKWSKAQGLTTYEQLMAGIRYLDLRVYKKDSGEMMIVHGMYSDNIENVISDIKKFITDHPKEIIIMDFNHFYNMKDNHEVLVKKLNETFTDSDGNNKLITNDKNVNNTLNEIWATGKQIIALYDDKATVDKHPELWSQNAIFSPWANKQKITDLKSTLQQILDGKPFNNTKNTFDCKKQGDCQSISKDKFFVLQGMMTPNTGVIAKNALLFLSYQDAEEDLKNAQDNFDKVSKKLETVKNNYNNAPFYKKVFYGIELGTLETDKKLKEHSLKSAQNSYDKLKLKYDSSANALLDFASITTPTIRDLIKTEWSNKDLNIIITDWFQITDIVEVIKELNKTR